MKKQITGVLAALVFVMLLAGCSQSSEGNEKEAETEPQTTSITAETPLANLEVEKMVTLGDYKNIELTMDAINISDEELEAFMNEIYTGSLTAELGGITDRAVEEGDTVIIDYEGKRDGVAFDGGTAKGANLQIGSGSFIPGFEEGLIGVMPGETLDLNISFPEDYWNEELAGVPVVFTVAVHCIIPTTVAYEEMQDAVIVSMGINDVNTVEEFRQFAYDYLYTYAEANRSYDIQDGILEALVNGSSYHDLPDGLLDVYREKILNNIVKAAETNGMTADVYSVNMYGMSAQEVADAYAEKTMQQELAMQALANAEGLTVSDEELDTQLMEYAQAAGYSSIDDILGGISKEEYRNYFMSEKVMAFLTEKANIRENE